MSRRFLKLLRTPETLELLKTPKAFALGTLIAFRAKRTNDFSIYNLKPGEALIGDHRSCGLTQREYRTAKKVLEKCGIATFRPTNKGTIAKLVNSDIFDINIETIDKQADNQKTNKRQASDKPATTINNRKEKKELKRNKQTTNPDPEKNISGPGLLLDEDYIPAPEKFAGVIKDLKKRAVK